MQQPALNTPLEIIEITKASLLLKNGDLYGLTAMSFPRGWKDGDTVKAEEKYYGEQFELVRLYNMSAEKNEEKAPAIKAAYRGNQFAKAFDEKGKRIPVLNMQLQIESIDKGIVMLKNTDTYRITSELPVGNTVGWAKDQFVEVSEDPRLKKSAYKMANQDTGNFAYGEFIGGK